MGERGGHGRMSVGLVLLADGTALNIAVDIGSKVLPPELSNNELAGLEVVHVNDKPSFSDHVTERIVHESLKGGRGVGESKEHDSGFK